MNLRDIKSISEIIAFLREQAALRAPENDEAGILIDAANDINDSWLELGDVPCATCGSPDHPTYECTQIEKGEMDAEAQSNKD